MTWLKLLSWLVSGGMLSLMVDSRSFSAPLIGPSVYHEQPPRNSWVAKPRQPTASSPQCGPVVRDGYVSTQVNVDANGCNIVGDAANEPSIAIDVTNPKRMAIGWRQFDSVASDFRQAGWGYSHDGGHTWVAPGAVYPGVFGSDPVLAADAEGVLYYVSIDTEEMRLFKSFDGGVSWAPHLQVVDYFYDKPWITIDHSTSVGRNNIYISSPTRPLLRSLDRGQTFQEMRVDVVGTTLTADHNGNLLLVDGNINLGFSKSIDIQDPAVITPTFEQLVLDVALNAPPQIHPNGIGFISQAWVTTNPFSKLSTGNIYLLTVASLDPRSEDNDPGDIVFIRSTDGGSIWSRPIAINDDALSSNSWQWFNTMSVAPNGRIDVVWNDTRNSQQRDLCELFYSYSDDAGKAWSPNVAVSPMFDSRVGRPAGNAKLGDYYHMVSDNLGANVAYAATFNGEQDIYFLRIGPWDCNGNEIDDAQDITSATSTDCNGNSVPDECEYRVDIDGDGLTTLDDWAAVAPLLAGPQADPPLSPLSKGGGHIGCHELFDADHDGDIDLADFAYLQRVFVSP